MIYSELKIARAKTKILAFLDFVQCLADLISGTRSVRSAVLSSPMRLEILLASLGKIIKCLYALEIGLASLGAIMRCLCCIYELELHLASRDVIIRCYVVCSYIYDLEILLAPLDKIIRCL